MAVNACGCGRMSTISISRTSPGRAPLTSTGPVSGCTGPAAIGAMRGVGGGGARGGGEVAGAAIGGLQHHLLALVDLEDGRDVRVQAVVSGRGLIAEQLGPVDL